MHACIYVLLTIHLVQVVFEYLLLLINLVRLLIYLNTIQSLINNKMQATIQLKSSTASPVRSRSPINKSLRFKCLLQIKAEFR